MTSTTSSSVPLSAPLYGASFPQAVSRYWRKYATFSGRASRSEYWWVTLFNFLVLLALSIAAGLFAAFGGGEPATSIPPAAVPVVILMALFVLASIVPGFALTVRRLHDGNFTGWLALLNLVPYAGIVVLIFMILPSNPEGARFDR